MRVATVFVLFSLGACAVTEAPRLDHKALSTPLTSSALDSGFFASPALDTGFLASPANPGSTTVARAAADSGQTAFRFDADPSSWHIDLPDTNAPPLGDDKIGRSYTELHLGWFDPHGDLSSLDTGFWGDIAFGRSFLSMLSVEASIGYFDTTGRNNAEVYGIPLLISAKLGVPIAIVEPYIGVGVGGVWANAKASGFGSHDDFALIYDGFIGIEFGLAGFSVGAEYRYVKSDNLEGPGGSGYQLEGNVFMLTGSLPF